MLMLCLYYCGKYMEISQPVCCIMKAAGIRNNLDKTKEEKHQTTLSTSRPLRYLTINRLLQLIPPSTAAGSLDKVSVQQERNLQANKHPV